jgi:hypothetical protein
MMELSVSPEFRTLCREIAGENRSEEEWAEIESDDVFQSENYAGGFDAMEEAFASVITPKVAKNTGSNSRFQKYRPSLQEGIE